MIFNKLLKNKVYNVPAYFKDTVQNLPLVLATPVQFTVRDFNNILIVSGICVQDTIDTGKWTATFTIPTSSPSTIAEDSYYSLTYTASLPNNTNRETVRLFEVQDDKIEILNEGQPLVLTTAMPLKDNLLISTPYTVDEYTISLRDATGAVLYTDGPWINPTIYRSNENYNIYVFQSTTIIQDILNSSTAPGNLFVEWNYKVAGESYLKINPVYILNIHGYNLINDLRMIIDKAKIVDIDPNMVWRDYELLHFVLKGIQRINGSNPPSNFDINNLPTALDYAVSKAALVELFQSWYLALGQKAFDFQGQDIQLNVDITSFIQTMMDQANSWLDNNLKDTKTSVIVAMSRGARGFTTISLSPTSNLVGTFYNSFFNFLQIGK